MKNKQLDFEQQEIKSQKKVIHQHLKLMLVEVKWPLNVALFFSLCGLIIFILQSWFIAHLFAHLLMQATGHGQIQSSTVNFDLIAILSCFISRPLFQFGREYLSQQASFKVRTNIQKRLISTLSQLGPGAKTFGSDGAISSKLIDQIDALDGYISRYYIQVLLVSLTPFIILGVIYFYSKIAVLIFAVTFPLVIVFMILVGSSAADKNRQQFAALSHLSGQFLDLMRGMRTLTHFNRTKQAEKLIYDSSEAYRKGTMEVLRLAFLSIGTLEFFSSLSIAGVALYLGLSLMGEIPGYQGTVLIPYQAALFVLLLAPEFYAPLRMLGSDYHAKAAAEGAIAELVPLFEAKVWTHPGQDVLNLTSAPSISIEKLSISTDKGVRLKPITFKVDAEERLLIKGPSGIGKSSLFEALLTFCPYSGEIFINNNISLQQISRESWQQYICYLSQSSKMVSGSIASNLRLANPDATNEQLFEVLEQVQLAEFVHQLPNQLETKLGERGLGLSGGQLSRLSIAQLLLKKGELWLIDEPTEHLDFDTASTILKLLAKITEHKTVLLISHQADSLDWLDRTILVE